MGRKLRISKKSIKHCRTIKSCVFILLVFLLVICLSGCFSSDNSKEFEDKIISELQVKESVLAKDIFDFEWELAFAIKEGYIDGESFAEKYGLDISIENVPESVNDQRRRIVFVDSDGEFVFLFSFWDSNKLCLAEDGIIIYPETEIHKSNKYKHGFCVEFLVQPEDYLVSKGS